MTPADLWLQLDAQRAVRGLSLRALARVLDCSPSTLTRWSQGRDPSAAVAMRALTWLDEPAPLTVDEIQAIEKSVARAERMIVAGARAHPRGRFL